ncbi:MAG: hypothetical protein Q8N63_04590 [Nanoarchaeota archaeon]|nr:hypothetical protein [Nanoarchaeota archaeon]
MIKSKLVKSKRSNSHSEFLFNKKIVNSKRSQSAIEFFILTGFLLFSFTIFFVAVQWNMSDTIREREELAVKNVAVTVQEEINSASQSMDGYYRNFTIPEKINGRKYEINITGGETVYLRTVDGRYALALPVQKVTGDLVKKPLINTIRKEDGVVYLN